MTSSPKPSHKLLAVASALSVIAGSFCYRSRYLCGKRLRIRSRREFPELH